MTLSFLAAMLPSGAKLVRARAGAAGEGSCRCLLLNLTSTADELRRGVSTTSELACVCEKSNTRGVRACTSGPKPLDQSGPGKSNRCLHGQRKSSSIAARAKCSRCARSAKPQCAEEARADAQRWSRRYGMRAGPQWRAQARERTAAMNLRK